MTHALPRPALRPLLLGLLALLLGGCTVTVTDGVRRVAPGGASDVLTRFEPRAGAGAGYRVGDRISFVLRSRRPGYVTLTSLDPDGRVRVFARNVFVPAGRDVLIDGSDAGRAFRVEPPRGIHRVRASFTPARTDTSRVSFRGRFGEDDWTAAIRVDLAPFEAADWAETRYFAR